MLQVTTAGVEVLQTTDAGRSWSVVKTHADGAAASLSPPSAAIAAGDLDEDGVLDVIYCIGTTCTVLWGPDTLVGSTPVLANWGTGTGIVITTLAPMHGAAAATQAIEELALFDLDGNGHLDVITASRTAAGDAEHFVRSVPARAPGSVDPRVAIDWPPAVEKTFPCGGLANPPCSEPIKTLFCVDLNGNSHTHRHERMSEC
jgi:hypothetical protein